MQEIIKNQISVKEEESGMRLDRLMAQRFPVIGREEWRSRILQGMVLLSDKTARPSRLLKKNEVIEFYYYKKEEPEVDFNVKILYEDENLLILDKPGNLPVHPSGIYYRHTLHEYLKQIYGSDFIPRPAHRLDRETSGILITAKDKKSASLLQKDFMNRKIYKEYIAFVEGNFGEYMDAAGILMQDARSPVRKKRKYLHNALSEDYPNSESARTELYPAQTWSNTSMVRAVLHTGRMHQIRATLLGLGYPVVGDRLYGRDDTLYLKMIAGEKSADDLKILRMNRTALHCSVMEFRHPRDQRRMQIRSEMPDDMHQFFSSLSEDS